MPRIASTAPDECGLFLLIAYRMQFECHVGLLPLPRPGTVRFATCVVGPPAMMGMSKILGDHLQLKTPFAFLRRARRLQL